jgi:hypothetical protein
MTEEMVERPVPVRFAALRGLGERGERAAKLLEQLADELRYAGSDTEAALVRQIDTKVAADPDSALEDVPPPDSLVEALSGRKRIRARRWVGLRNAAALLPLLATWFFLAWSAFAYQQELSADPAKINVPFLLLWERRFDGAAIPSFSATALITFALLIGVLVMTVLGQWLESRAADTESSSFALVDSAMDAVREAVRHGTPAAPQSAEEWAVAAQQILNHTQRVLDESVQQTKDLVAENRKITESARVALETVRADAHTFVEKLSGDTRSTLQAIQDQNKQFIERTAEEALGLLKAALEANRTLFVDEMRPLVKDFRTTLEDFVRHHETYRDSAQLLAASSTSMDESARVLAGSAKSYTEIATSIDDHLRILEGTQEEFVGRVTSSADSMRSASDTMLEVSKALSGDVKTEIEKLARNVVNASADVASINKSLVASSKAMGRVTATLDGKLIPSLDRLVGSIGDAAEKLRTGHGPKRWWQR